MLWKLNNVTTILKRADDSYMTELSVKQSEQVLSSPPEVLLTVNAFRHVVEFLL